MVPTRSIRWQGSLSLNGGALEVVGGSDSDVTERLILLNLNDVLRLQNQQFKETCCLD